MVGIMGFQSFKESKKIIGIFTTSLTVFLLLNSSVSFASIDSLKDSSKSKDFKTQMAERTAQLKTELQQFKNREKSIPKEKKEIFASTITALDSRWQALDEAVTHLKTHPLKSEKNDVQKMASALEKELDKNESSFGDSQFGLGELLGF